MARQGPKPTRGGQGQRQSRRAISVSYADGTNLRYEVIGGKIYETRGEIPREIETNLTLDQIKANLIVNGANVEELSKKDLEEIDKERRRYSAEWNKILERAELGWEKLKRGSR